MPELAIRAATAFGDAMRSAMQERGGCAIALSGGSTPGPMFRHLAQTPVEWRDVHVCQVDERAAPTGHHDRNLTLIERELLARIAGDRPRLHAMPVDESDLDAAAAEYANELESVCGRPPTLDVVHLGIGDDGHIASLVPGDPVLDVRDRWVAATDPYKGYRRLTLTFPVLERASVIVFLVVGRDKAAALADMLAGDASLPAARLNLRGSVIFADPAAAAAVSA